MAAGSSPFVPLRAGDGWVCAECGCPLADFEAARAHLTDAHDIHTGEAHQPDAEEYLDVPVPVTDADILL